MSETLGFSRQITTGHRYVSTLRDDTRTHHQPVKLEWSPKPHFSDVHMHIVINGRTRSCSERFPTFTNSICTSETTGGLVFCRCKTGFFRNSYAQIYLLTGRSNDGIGIPGVKRSTNQQNVILYLNVM